MSDNYVFDGGIDATGVDDGSDNSVGSAGDSIGGTVNRVRKSTNMLGVSARTFANAMTKAFSQAVVGGKQFDDVLKSLVLRLSNMTLAGAFKPFATGLSKGVGQLFSGVFGPGLFPGSGGGGGSGGDGLVAPTNNCCCQPSNGGCFGGGIPNVFTALPRTVFPFATGGVISTPGYFPLVNGGLGLAGEAGPEAIMPLSRAGDGSLGVTMTGAAAPANITVQIATPDIESFRRSEAYITGQIARAVARGQRSL